MILVLAWAGRAPAADPRPARDWRQSRGAAYNPGAVVLDAPASGPPRRWTFEAGGRVLGYEPGTGVWSSPAVGVSRGRALVVAGSYDHNVYALDAESGAELWRFTTGAAVRAAPALWHDGERLHVYVTAGDRLLYALDGELGAREWVFAAADYRPTIGGARLTAPAVGRSGGRDAVFFGYWVWDRSFADNQQESGVVAVDARSGALLWRVRTGDNELTAPAYVESTGGARLFLGSTNGTLSAFDADSGGLAWRRSELDAVLGAPAVFPLASGTRVVTSSKYGLVRCLDATSGAELWRYKTGDWVTAAPAAAMVGGRPLVVVGSYDRSLYALDLLSGELVWRYFARGALHAAAAIVAQASSPWVLAAAWDHHLHVVSAKDGRAVARTFTGAPLWDTLGLEHSEWSAPVAVRLRGVWTAYVASYDGKLYSLPLEELVRGGVAEPRDAAAFWLSLAGAIAATGLVARWLTVRHRRGRGRA